MNKMDVQTDSVTYRAAIYFHLDYDQTCSNLIESRCQIYCFLARAFQLLCVKQKHAAKHVT